MANLQDLLFDVEKVSFFEKFGIETNDEYKNLIIGHIDGKERVLNACSDRYELMPNREIFPVINDILNTANINYSSSFRSINNARFYGDYVIEDQSIEIAKGDIIKPRIQIQHSYNGLRIYAIIFGYFRTICTNGLIIPVESKNHLNLNIVGKHTIEIKNSFDKLLTNLERFTNESEKLSENFRMLADREVLNLDERLKEVMETANIKKGQELITNTIKMESEQLFGGVVNDWLIYNGINEYIHNDQENKKAPEARQKIDQNVMDFLLVN